MPSKGNQYLVEAVPEIVRAASVGARVHRRRRRAASASSRRRRGRSVSAIGWCSPASSATSPRCSRRSTIVVFPSLWEGTPLTAFEALAAGKPIVATDADGLLDILTDRHDSLVVPKRNAGGAGARRQRADRAARIWRQRLARDARAHRRAVRHRARSCARWSGCTRSCTRRRGPPAAPACCRPTSAS